MDIRYQARTVTLLNGRLDQIVEGIHSNGVEEIRTVITRRIIDTMEQQTREALIALGWAPPKEK